MFKANHILLLASKSKSPFQVGDDFIYPCVTWQTPETSQSDDDRAKLQRFFLGEWLGIDGKVGITVTIVNPSAILLPFERSTPTCFAFHEFDIIKDLTTTYASYTIIVEEGLLALVDEVFNVVSMSSVPKAFIESLVAYSCILIGWHNSTG